MATNIDTSLAATTVSVAGSAITISGLTANEQAILTIALCALAEARKEGVGGGKAYGQRYGRSTGAVEQVTITVGAG